MAGRLVRLMVCSSMNFCSQCGGQAFRQDGLCHDCRARNKGKRIRTVPEAKFEPKRTVRGRRSRDKGKFLVGVAGHVLNIYNPIVAGETVLRSLERRLEFEAMQGPVKRLCHNGVWLVPPDQRPRGWQAMGLKEKPASETR